MYEQDYMEVIQHRLVMTIVIMVLQKDIGDWISVQVQFNSNSVQSQFNSNNSHAGCLIHYKNLLRFFHLYAEYFN